MITIYPTKIEKDKTELDNTSISIDIFPDVKNIYLNIYDRNDKATMRTKLTLEYTHQLIDELKMCIDKFEEFGE